MIRTCLLWCLLCFSAAAFALDPMPFKDRDEELRFQDITRELRCLVCQNQNIADSNADLARDLRLEVFEMMREGKSDDEIKTFMTERYGDFVLYRPPMKPSTWLLWFGPFLVLLAGGFLLIRHIRGRQRARAEATSTAATPSTGPDDPNEMIP
ncbi:cytochrome C biogenesis protein [Ahniella affigens]|uniref:Cytochrome c-type biogenesis protein n=1 Tax=Ahniella affigens TaxID=2021234 RepID=A0A2P1PQF3_9GAMM|nr:cytochrome c-type biogenesis protein [Ahniella affigens]AVP97071.1 cytochrome C biogenesis protein [Ahniella affigens]